MIFNFSDEKFGFIRQEDYTSKTVNVDCVFKNTKTTISKTAVHKNINDLTNLVVSVQNLYDYSFSEEINTTRLHFWLPLLCNNANVKLFNKNTKQIFVSGDDDNQGQTINRFTGLFEISQDKEKLRDLITQLKDDTLNKINKLLIISDIPADN
jgi:hypothetical protein